MNIKRAAYIALSIILVPAGGLAMAIIFGASPPPPPLETVDNAVKILQASLVDQPAVEHYRARDGAELAIRRYPGAKGGGTAVLVHGSSASSHAVHLLGKALAAAGITSIAPDLRGHGQNRPLGDIVYTGQLDDDITDLMDELDTQYPGEPRILIGHSSGGGFALRLAGGPIACRFDGYLALAPYLNFRSAATRTDAGGWAKPFIPRIIALGLLNGLGVYALDGLPAVAFAVNPDRSANRAVSYSWRLLKNFGLDQMRWEGSIRSIRHPAIVMVGAEDEMFFAGNYQPELAALQPAIEVRVLAGIDHMGLVIDAGALNNVVTTAQEMLKAPPDGATNCRPKSAPSGGS